MSSFVLPPVISLSLREKLAQLIFVRIGSNLPPVRVVEQDEERVARLLNDCPIGGLLLFNGGQGCRGALDRLQSRSRIPLLVASDIERGVGQQVKGFTLFPHAMAFDRLGAKAESAVADFGHTLAAEARQAGIHITFGPVADVNTNPQNPIIATRAFSESPDRAASLTRAFVTAAEQAGLGTTAKHFPGHGDTHQDSHDSLPTVERSAAELRSCELVPFQSAIDAGCSLVMTAHVSYPALDPSGLPATLSPTILQTLLRHEMGFRGIICSDSLLMAGVRDRFANEPEMALATLSAGVDLLLDLHEPAQVVDFLCQCVARGELAAERVEEAFARVWVLKQRILSNTFATVGNEGGGASPAITSADSQSLADRIAHDALEIHTSRPAALPFNRSRSLAAILLKPFETAIDPPEQPLAAALREQFRYVDYVQLGPKSNSADYATALQVACRAEQVVVAMIVRPAAWHAFGLRIEQQAFVETVLRQRPETVLVSLGVPYALRNFASAATTVCSYSDVPCSQRAVAGLLSGGTANR
ncbi:MAG: hypothetical protein IT425_12030 [Pirellulales bacterium]|nr:hypothetical protein [Pirellulales bacterium]